MEMKKYWSSFGSQTVKLGKDYNVKRKEDEIRVMESGWRLFLRKIKRIKTNNKRSFGSAASVLKTSSSYDLDTYSKNFDQGIEWTEPDYLSRSFSARYADPYSRF